MEKMLVTQGLNELKLLDSRIRKGISESTFVTSAKKSSDNVGNGLSKDDFKSNSVSSLQSICALIARRSKIKKAIIKSNACTNVVIDGKTYTVAEAIDMKSAIEYDEDLLFTIKDQYASASRNVQRNNAVVEEKLEKLILTGFGKERKDKVGSDYYNAIAIPFMKSNEFEIVDPIDSLNLINKKEEEISAFKSTVDSVLQVSNCTTYIEF